MKAIRRRVGQDKSRVKPVLPGQGRDLGWFVPVAHGVHPQYSPHPGFNKPAKTRSSAWGPLPGVIFSAMFSLRNRSPDQSAVFADHVARILQVLLEHGAIEMLDNGIH